MEKRQLNKKQEDVFLYLGRAGENGNDASIGGIAEKLGMSRQDVVQTIQELQEIGYIEGPPSLLAMCMDALKEMDPELKPTDNGYAAFVVLVASAKADTADEEFLAHELSYDLDFVKEVGSRLRAAKVWVGKKLSPLRFKAWSEGASFWIDALIGNGDFVRVGGPDDEPKYKMTDGGKNRVERMMKKD